MSVFREATPAPIEQAVNIVDGKQSNDPSTSENLGSSYIDPKESDGVVLRSLGFSEEVSNIPSEDQQSLSTVRDFVNKIIQDKGLRPEASSYKKVLDELRSDLDLDEATDPSIILNKTAGIINAWRDIAFIKDPKERRSIFMKLAKLPDNRSINKAIFEEMEKHKVYQ